MKDEGERTMSHPDPRNVCDGCGQSLDRRRREHVVLGPIVHTRVWRRLADDAREQLCLACMNQRAIERFGKAVPDSLNRTYSAGQIVTLSKLSRGTIEELVRFGLLNPRGGLFGFRDLASARQNPGMASRS